MTKMKKSKKEKSQNSGVEFPNSNHRLKIQGKYVSRVGGNKAVPSILLKGEWLRKCGFESNMHVRVRSQLGRLFIELDGGNCPG